MSAAEDDTLSLSIDASVHQLDRALNAIESLVGEVADRDYLAHLLADLVEAKRNLARVFDATEKALLAVSGTKSYEVPNLGMVEVKRKTSYKAWQHDELVKALVARIADEPGIFYDPEAGDRLPPAQMVANAVARLREAMSPSWKVTGIRAFGLDESEFCQVDPQDFSVKLPSRSES